MSHDRGQFSIDSIIETEMTRLSGLPTQPWGQPFIQTTTDVAKDENFHVSISGDSTVITENGATSASTLELGNRVVSRGGMRQVLDISFDTIAVQTYEIAPGILSPSGKIKLRGDQYIRVVDARVSEMFSMNAALVKVEHLKGLAGITSIGSGPRIDMTVTLSILDAIYIDRLWVQAVPCTGKIEGPWVLERDEARLLFLAAISVKVPRPRCP